jgi:predicted lipoprotein with Yx(FWY)xxD motif
MTSYLGATRRLAALGAIALMTAACGSGAATPTTAPSIAAAGSAPATGSVVGTATTSLGVVLVAPNGFTLYMHGGDSANTSSCTAGCLAAWPPLVVPAGGSATAGPGVTGTVGTFTRADNGTTQVTYKGLPLYLWKSDTKPGDVTGQGIGGFSVAKP